MRHARIIHQDVRSASKVRAKLVECLFDAFLLPYIASERQGICPKLFGNLFRDRAHFPCRPRRDSDRCSFTRESDCNCAPNAAPAAGDERKFVRQLHAIDNNVECGGNPDDWSASVLACSFVIRAARSLQARTLALQSKLSSRESWRTLFQKRAA